MNKAIKEEGVIPEGRIKEVSTPFLEEFAKKGRETALYPNLGMGLPSKSLLVYSLKLSPGWGLGH